MTNLNFIKYLKTILNGFTYTDSFIDESKSNSICVYQRNGAAPLSRRTGFKLYPCTLCITFGQKPGDAQITMNEIFELLYEQKEQSIDDISFVIIIRSNPVFLGKTDAGFWRYALDLDIYFRKENK